jgi:hypothetical protein
VNWVSPALQGAAAVIVELFPLRLHTPEALVPCDRERDSEHASAACKASRSRVDPRRPGQMLRVAPPTTKKSPIGHSKSHPYNGHLHASCAPGRSGSWLSLSAT